MTRSTCIGVVVTTVVDENPVEADGAKVSREGLLCQASGEGEGICKRTVV